jgi:Zn-dependent M32 family carboxypeptidase
MQQQPQGTTTLWPTCISTAYVEKMVWIASNSSGEDAWQLARNAEHYHMMKPVLEKIFSIPASSSPVERAFNKVA